MNTYAPSSTNCFAAASPIPLLPPVTSAILPSSFAMFCVSLVFAPNRARPWTEALADRRDCVIYQERPVTGAACPACPGIESPPLHLRMLAALTAIRLSMWMNVVYMYLHRYRCER